MTEPQHAGAARRRRRGSGPERTDVPSRWPAPRAGTPVDAVVTVPGSKSMTARALLLAAGSVGPSTLLHPSKSRDSVVLARGLRTMGCHVSSVDEQRWLLRPRPLTAATVDVEDSGTAMRFLPALAGLADGDVTLDGTARLRGYPLDELVGALRAVGCRADTAGGALPLTVHGRGRVPGGAVTLDASGSSQLVSGLLLAGTDFDNGVVLRHVGPPLAVRPHIDMTVTMLRAAGGAVDDADPYLWEVEPGRLVGRAWEIEPDLAGAAPFLAAALVTGGRVRVPDWPARTAQSGTALRELLTAFGARCAPTTEGLTVSGTGTLRGVTADVSPLADLVPVIAALCALADSPSTLRVNGEGPTAGLVEALGTLGGVTRATGDELTVTPVPLHGGVFPTGGDHRLAFAGAVLGLVVPGVVLSDVACAAKSVPDFASRWSLMLGEGP